MQPISAVRTNSKVVVPAQNEADSLYQEGFGSKVEANVLRLESFEVLYLQEKGKIIVIDEETQRALSFQELLWIYSDVDDHVWARYIVYRDLRGRGFVARGGSEGKVSFLVYERGSYFKKPPSYMAYTVSEGLHDTILDLKGTLEVAEKKGYSTKLAVVDRRGEIVYYSLSKIDMKKSSNNEEEAPAD
jgi:tRNA-intron endonuclease